MERLRLALAQQPPARRPLIVRVQLFSSPGFSSPSLICFVFDRFGQYLATTLPVCVNDDKNLPINTNNTGEEAKLDDSSPAALVASRNEGLSLLFKLLLVHDKGVNQL